MSSISSEAPVSLGLPAGWRAVPVWAGDQDAPLRLCAVVRQKPDPAGGWLVNLGERPDASIYLGCVVDAGGRVREWLEWWVQDVDRLAASPGAAGFKEVYCNARLDEQWASRATALQRLAPELLLQTQWETAHPPPLWIDPARGEPLVHDWELCGDDAALTAAGLPPYGASLHRYLWQGAAAPALVEAPAKMSLGKGIAAAPTATFLPMTTDAPLPPDGPRLTAANVFGSAIPFNPAGGLMMARSFLPLEYEQFTDVLGGVPWPGLAHGKEFFPVGSVYDELARLEEPEYQGGHLFSGPQGRTGRLAERFHLKIGLLLGAIRTVRRMVRERQLPLLNLSGASFRVKLSDASADLPFLWNARPVLRLPGEAVALPVETASGVRYFLPGMATLGAPSLYRPEALGRYASGSGTIRLRKLFKLEAGSIALEGTLVAQDNLPSAVSDLLRLRLRLGATGQRVDLYAQLDPSQGLAPGEVRFRTVAQQLPEPIARTLAEAEGAVFSAVPFETLPVLSSPCDLYALGVLAVRTLLVNGSNTLAVALDELFSFARQTAPSPDETVAVPLAGRLEFAAQEDVRWLEALGPQRLTHEGFTTAQAFDQLPAALWWQTLAAILRFFPGLHPESICRDFGDAPSSALETVFDQPIRQLENLALRSRSLIVVDWRQNREIRSIIDQCMML
jgi:hypothetical protein